MKVLAVRSIPLSQDTMNAWRSTEYDFKFLGRGRVTDKAIDVAKQYDYDVVLNLGATNVPDDELVVTPAATVKLLQSAKSLRASALGALVPPKPLYHDPCWEKTKGFGGDGKVYIAHFDPALHNKRNADYQRHIVGVIDPCFNNGSTNEHIKALMIEIKHHVFKFTLTHLTMSNAYFSFRQYLFKFTCNTINIFYLVM